jgi:adhesin transport system membrane fusion protein
MVPSTDQMPMLPVIRRTELPRLARWVARCLLFGCMAIVTALGFLPWQQNVRGIGRVTAFAPLERQQEVKAAIKGRVMSWKEGLREGSLVRQGDVLCEIQGIDPFLIRRLEQQVLYGQRKRDASRQKIDEYREQVIAFTEARQRTIEAGLQGIEAAKQKVAAEEQALIAAKAGEDQVRVNVERRRQMFAEQLVSRLDLEQEERKYLEAAAKLREAEAKVAGAKADVSSKQAELELKTREADAKISSAEATLRTAEGDVAVAEKELVESESKLAQQRSQSVASPIDGTLLRLLVNQGGEIVSEGDPLFIVVPDQAERAVELWLDGNDIPLVSEGRQVRLQFEGWPAVQFVGWPSAAVGTFGGQIVNIDSTDNGKGEFRVLVMPLVGEEKWPTGKFLRQGQRANGWVLLDRVPLWYEFWRQINGFPPVVSMEEPKADAKDKSKSGGEIKLKSKK